MKNKPFLKHPGRREILKVSGIIATVAVIFTTIAVTISANAASVIGKNLSCGNLHGWFQVSSSWYNGEGHNYSNPTDYTNTNNVAPMLNFLNGFVDVMTTSSNSFGGQSHGWYTSFVRFGETSGGGDNSGGWTTNGLQSPAQFNACITNVMVPFINHCVSRGLYVVMCGSASGTNDGNGSHNMSQGYLNNLNTWWQAVANAPGIKNNPYVMFEICNEPIQVESVMGNGDWGSGQPKYWQGLQAFENQVVNTIRNTGATNIILGTSLGYESENQGWALYPLSGSNIAYAAHFYPGYITPHDDPNQVLIKWNSAYQPAANIAPLVITECMWTPNDGTGYQDLWNASTAGFGTALKTMIDNAGNVSWLVGMPGDLVTNLDNGLSGLTLTTKDGAQASFQWWADYAGAGSPPFPGPTINSIIASTNQINLSWTASVGATNYNIKRATVSGGPYTVIALDVTGTTYTNIGLPSSTAFYYVVSAKQGITESANSAEAGAATFYSPYSNIATNGTATASADNPPNETAAMAFDGSTSTKWFNNNAGSTGWLQYNFGVGINRTVIRYALSSANDVPGRDPRNWQFQGSQNGTSWTTLDNQTAQTFTNRLQTMTYNISNSTAYQYYRLNITANNGDATGIQLSEMSLMVSTGSPPPPAPAAPTGLAGTAASSSQIYLTWNASTNALGYNLKRSITNGGSYTIIAASLSSTNFNDFGLSANTAYYYVVSAVNASGESTNSVQASAITPGFTPPKFTWSTPVPFAGLTADQILTNFPNTKIAGAMRMNGGPTTVTLDNGSPIVFADRNNWAGISGGFGTFGGAINNAFDASNANFNACLDNFYSDSSAYTITLSNLVVGQQYSVQLFALDNRSGLSPDVSSRTANYQDPNDATDVSATFAMNTNVYIVGTFIASNSTVSIQENLFANSGNFNCLVLRAVGWNPPPYFAAQPANGGGYLGGSAVFNNAVVAGDTTIANPTITYQWAMGPVGGPYTNLVEGSKYSGTTTASLVINNCVNEDTAMVYVLKASNGGGTTTSREATLTLQPAVTPMLLGHWLSGAANYTDTSGYTPAGTHDGFLSGSGTVYYFTNDVPPNATGANSLYLGGNVALVISNTSASLDVGYANTFDDTISNRFTVMFWAKGFPNSGTWSPALMAKRGEDNVGWQIRRKFNNNPIFTLRGTPGDDDPDGSVTVDSTGWHHYAATWDGLIGLRRWYVDGKLSTQITGDSGPMAMATNYQLTIGARESSTAGTEEAAVGGMTFYDVRVYNYAMSLSEVGTTGRIPPQPLSFQQSGGNQLTLTWPYGTLLEATNILGPWTTNAVASPYSPDITKPQKYFRIRNP